MANIEVPENPEFTEDIRKLETTDPGHANIFNAVFEPIINNVLHVKKMITDHMMAKNPHGIKPADLGLENVENKPMGELSTEFTVAGTRSNIQSGQAMKTILGMLSRWYTDLKTVAWSGKYNDLTDKPTIPNGAAASCAVANNDTTTAAGSVADARIVRQHGLEIDEINRDLGGYQFRLNNGVPEYKAGADAVWVPFKSPELITCKSGLSGIKVTITKTGTYIIVASRGGLRSGNVYVTVSGSEVTKIDHTLANNGGWLWSITSDVYEGMLNTGTTITVTGESKEDGVTAPVSMIVYKL